MTGSGFRQIAAELRERIALGDITAGALDSEAELGRSYQASRVTVRKALELLREEGLVESRQGAGWFVAGSSFHQKLALGTFRHAGSAVTAAGQQLQRRIVSFAFVPAPEHVATILDCDPGAEVLRCRSVRSAGGEPLERCTEWLDGDRAAALSRSQAAEPGIWNTLARNGSVIAAVRQSITAGIAGSLDGELLGAVSGTPLLLIRRVAIEAGRPLALSDHRYLAHRFSLEVEFHGWSGRHEDPPGLRQEITAAQ